MKMGNRAAVLSCAIVAFAASAAAGADWVIVPGHRAGPITAGSDEQGLVEAFGAENVRSAQVDVGEGMSEPGTVLFPDDPSRTAFILWHDPTRHASPKSLSVRHPRTVWRTKRGITIGTALRDLETLNGKPFSLAGFDWDYAGTVLDSRAGRLRELGTQDSTGVRGRTLILRLAPDDSKRGTRAYASVQGDRAFSSGHPAMQELNPRVYEMIVEFAAE